MSQTGAPAPATRSLCQRPGDHWFHRASTPSWTRTSTLRGVSTALWPLSYRRDNAYEPSSGPAWNRTTDLLRVEQALLPAELQAQRRNGQTMKRGFPKAEAGLRGREGLPAGEGWSLGTRGIHAEHRIKPRPRRRRWADTRIGPI